MGVKMLSKDQVEKLLEYTGVDLTKANWKGNNINFCCPIHHESHPSCGINIDYVPTNPDGSSSSDHLQVFNCLACHEKGSLETFLFKALPDDFKYLSQAYAKMQELFDLEYSFNYNNERELRRYEDLFVKSRKELRYVMSKVKLAVFKSGKETYQYFFKRGFTKQNMRDYLIGRDLDNETVTMPVFWEDGELAGVIGRYIDPYRPKNMRFMIYEFEKSKLIYPLDKLEATYDTLIVVEAILDVIMMRNWSYDNTITTFTNSISEEQARLIESRCKKVILLFDNDDGGRKGIELAKQTLKGRVVCLEVTYPPIELGKDPSEWGEELTWEVVNSAHSIKRLPRME